MTKEQAIKELKIMQSGAKIGIRYAKRNKEISEEERKEDIEIYQDQLEALEIATKALEQQPSDDCVSRQQAIEFVNEVPPVTPTLKSGLHWIERFDNENKWLECPHCHKDSDNAYNYCPNCGASFKAEKRGNKND